MFSARTRGCYTNRDFGYGLGRSRLKGQHGQEIWTEWTILAYNTDTLAVRAQ
jgi:hypothetical protein